MRIQNLNTSFLADTKSKNTGKDGLLKKMGLMIPKTLNETLFLNKQNKCLLERNYIHLIKNVYAKCNSHIKIVKDEYKVYIGTLNPRYLFVVNNLNGVLGYTIKNSTYIFIKVNKDQNLQKKAICATFAHEYYHACRNLRMGSLKKKLVDHIIEEGMAECFVETVLGTSYLNPWARKVKIDEIVEHSQLIIESLESSSPDLIYSLLHGDIKYQLPQWIGYSLGYRFVHWLIHEEGNVLEDLIEIESYSLVSKLREYILYFEGNNHG